MFRNFAFQTRIVRTDKKQKHTEGLLPNTETVSYDPAYIVQTIQDGVVTTVVVVAAAFISYRLVDTFSKLTIIAAKAVAK